MSLLSKIDLPILTSGRSKVSQKVPKVEKEPKVSQKPPFKLKKAIKPRSKKRAKEEAQYNREVKVWKVGKMCAVYPDKKAVDCHHIRGREGAMLLEQKFWLPVSREGHRKIENNPEWARSQGFIINRGQKVDENR